MNIVYMGTPEFAATALSALIEAGHNIKAVITQPDKAKGRSKALVPTPVKEVALANNISVYQPEKVRDEETVKLLKDINPDVIVVAAYGQILPESILDIPKLGCINIHASLLPKYRGAAPIERAIIDGEKLTGVTTMYMEKGLDTGDMIDKKKVVIEDTDTGESLRAKLANEGAKLIIKTLEDIKNKKARREKQDDSQSTYAKMLYKEMGKIDFSKSALSIERLVRGLNPWPSAYTNIDGKNVKIYKARVKKIEEVSAKPGEIIEVTKKSFTIMCGEDALTVLELQPEGKKNMPAAAFLNGNKLEVGKSLA